MAESHLVKTAIGRSFGCPICCILYLHRSSSVVERPSSTTDWQPHRGFSVPRPDICSQSVYLTLAQRSEPKNPRFQTHFLTLNPHDIRGLNDSLCCFAACRVKRHFVLVGLGGWQR